GLVRRGFGVARRLGGWWLLALRQMRSEEVVAESWKVRKVAGSDFWGRSPALLRDPCGHLGAGAETELGHDVRQVGLHRAFGKEELVGDRRAGHPGGHKPGDLDLTTAQAVPRPLRRAGS